MKNFPAYKEKKKSQKLKKNNPFADVYMYNIHKKIKPSNIFFMFFLKQVNSEKKRKKLKQIQHINAEE